MIAFGPERRALSTTSPFAGVLDGVADQVRQHLLEDVATPHRRHRRSALDADADSCPRGR